MSLSQCRMASSCMTKLTSLAMVKISETWSGGKVGLLHFSEWVRPNDGANYVGTKIQLKSIDPLGSRKCAFGRLNYLDVDYIWMANDSIEYKLCITKSGGRHFAILAHWASDTVNVCPLCVQWDKHCARLQFVHLCQWFRPSVSCKWALALCVCDLPVQTGTIGHDQCRTLNRTCPRPDRNWFE